MLNLSLRADEAYKLKELLEYLVYHCPPLKSDVERILDIITAYLDEEEAKSRENNTL